MEGVGAASLAAAAVHADFDIDSLASWGPGQPTPFSFLASAFEAIGSDTKRLVKTQQLIVVFRVILGRTPEDLLPAVYLCTNQVAPAHEATELGIGDAILVRVITCPSPLSMPQAHVLVVPVKMHTRSALQPWSIMHMNFR